MRALRLFLFLLLSLAIPAHGFATLAVAPPPCPMQHAAGKPAADVQGEVAKSDAGCCSDAAAKTGKLCKTGQDCKIGSLGQAPERIEPGTTPVSNHPIACVDHPRFDASRTRIWRPPSLLLMT